MELHNKTKSLYLTSTKNVVFFLSCQKQNIAANVHLWQNWGLTHESGEAMNSPFLFSALILASTFYLGCANSTNTATGSGFGAPSIGAIVDSATPSNLKSTTTTSYFLEKFLGINSAIASSATCTAAGSVSSGCGTAENFLEFLRSEVFQKVTGGSVAATLYYRYWVDVLDTAMTQTDTRVKSNSTSACLSQTPVSVDFTFNVSGADVTVTSKLQCWETQTGTGATTQNMAFGKDSSNFYLVYRTNDNATTAGSGIRIVLAKAALDGTTADIWFLGASYQTPMGGGATQRRGNLQRVMANKTTKAFTFNTVEEDDTAKGYLFGSFFANTDGTNLYMEAAYGGGSAITDVTGMTRAAPYCAALSAITTPIAASNCATINAANLPSGFGLTAPMTNSSTGSATLWQANDTTEAAFEAAVDTIVAKDYTAAGVGVFQ